MHYFCFSTVVQLWRAIHFNVNPQKLHESRTWIFFFFFYMQQWVQQEGQEVTSKSHPSKVASQSCNKCEWIGGLHWKPQSVITGNEQKLAFCFPEISAILEISKKFHNFGKFSLGGVSCEKLNGGDVWWLLGVQWALRATGALVTYLGLFLLSNCIGIIILIFFFFPPKKKKKSSNLLKWRVV